MNQQWFIIKTQEGYCQIISVDNGKPSKTEQLWGPFNSQEEAITRRVGLIRAGKCKPV